MRIVTNNCFFPHRDRKKEKKKKDIARRRRLVVNVSGASRRVGRSVGLSVYRSVGQSIEIEECRRAHVIIVQSVGSSRTVQRASINQTNSTRSFDTTRHYPLFTVSAEYIASSARGNDRFLFKKLALHFSHKVRFRCIYPYKSAPFDRCRGGRRERGEGEERKKLVCNRTTLNGKKLTRLRPIIEQQRETRNKWL